MAVGALWQLGASEAQMCVFARHYAERLTPLTSELKASEAHFDRRLQEEGLDAVLKEQIPRLIPHADVFAYYGLLRTAYGVALDSPSEIASGLAYWAEDCHGITCDTEGAALPIAEALAVLAHACADQQRSEALVRGRQWEVSQNTVFRRHLPNNRSADF